MKQLMDRVLIQSSKEMGTTVHMAKRVICNRKLKDEKKRKQQYYHLRGIWFTRE